MKLRKLSVVIFSSIVLGIQIYVILPGTPHGRYWPFMNYGMYSTAKQLGDTFRISELRVKACGQAVDTVRLSAEQLHVRTFLFNDLLEGAVGLRNFKLMPVKDGSAKFVSNLIKRYRPERFCIAQIWSQTFALAPEGLFSLNEPSQMMREWSLVDSGQDPSRSKRGSARQ